MIKLTLDRYSGKMTQEFVWHMDVMRGEFKQVRQGINRFEWGCEKKKKLF